MNADNSADRPLQPDPPPTAHLFVLRLWLVSSNAPQPEWRGRLQHVNSGETRYFREWRALITQLQALLNIQAAASQAQPPDAEML
jgi:hypothetical protein